MLIAPLLMGFHGHPDIWWEADRNLCEDLKELLIDSQASTERVREDVMKCERVEEEVLNLPEVIYYN